MRDGCYSLEDSTGQEILVFDGLSDVFDASRITSSLAQTYEETIRETINGALVDGHRFGALVIEPIIHAASGMILIDPLFQRLLVRFCRQMKIPIVFDEVFVGTFRLGYFSGTQLLHEIPDIACYGKSLTGGVVPMAVTLASEQVFSSFLGSSKLDALLHGHSYTAHPVGCATALKALDLYTNTLLAHHEVWSVFPREVR